ncbi:hypothetical protein CYMTET_19559 [Cymbomonas tetramitiformis]|uniref:Uncharacterized protein n=1 Tax=Cymbomonas tetramitiformis TaxID=36881 RepID=A0AAE0G5T3_9CHLO|nr:hypothetical protein CYMTET_19559 [Cymbomonas tetramitiformis]
MGLVVVGGGWWAVEGSGRGEEALGASDPYGESVEVGDSGKVVVEVEVELGMAGRMWRRARGRAGYRGLVVRRPVVHPWRGLRRGLGGGGDGDGGGGE